MNINNPKQFVSFLMATVFSISTTLAQRDSVEVQQPAPWPVVADAATLFFVQANLGPFSAQQRVVSFKSKT